MSLAEDHKNFEAQYWLNLAMKKQAEARLLLAEAQGYADRAAALHAEMKEVAAR